MKKIIVFASGTKDGGGSGFEELVNNSQSGILKASIVAVISNHASGGVNARAQKLGIPFVHFTGPWIANEYQKIVQQFQPDLVCLSGWLKPVVGLDSRKTINIHPGPLPRFGGAGMYGHHVHEAVIDAFHKGEIKNSAITMHFVTEKYDDGPVFFQFPISLEDNDTADSLASKATALEHKWQSWATDLVINDEIYWDGKNPASLIMPDWYKFNQLI